ncbi:MAG TPA: molybdopterin molybdotransferase MoeA [Steroidobacteraceae bacterium]|jgi:molybdopterin molybdotransferase|nr:molybdopterin molybdotransferase MoeA [Steroidobacteraceae bacterium]
MAEAAIENRIARLPEVARPLERCLGQTLRENVYAERENPPFDRVCMDGIAISSDVAHGGVREYLVEATQAAGVPAGALSKSGSAIEVMTGAMLPDGADCVIPLEEYDLADRVARLKVNALLEPYRNVQRRGADSRPGEPMLRSGVRLNAPEVAIVASAGLASVRVSRQPRVVVASTGDELVEPGQPIAQHQIRRSNAYAIVASLTGYGFEEVQNDHILDDENMLRARLAQHLAGSDALILSGGVSKGKFDLVPKILKELGVEEIFHQVAQRPGMPMWFGMSPPGCAVFGLPGNPIATMVCLARYVVPALVTAQGAQRRWPLAVALAAPVKRGRTMTSFVPVQVRCDAQGRHLAMPRIPNGSGDFLALAGTDGFVELPPQAESYPEGFIANMYRW